MSITPHFVADPPQWIKRGIYTTGDSLTGWEVGDRVSWRTGAPADTLTYACTVAGDGSGVFNPASASTYTWGTTQWSLITPSSWANASPIGRKSVINYVDCNATRASSVEGTAIIYVEPSTMRPRTARVKTDPAQGFISNPVDGIHGPTFFGPMGASHYHARTRFGEKLIPAGFESNQAFVDSEGIIAAANFDGWTSRGMRITISGSNDQYPTVGAAITTNLNSSTPSTYSLPRWMLEPGRRFGVHVNHNGVGTVWNGKTGTYSPTGQLLYRAPEAYISDNSFSPPEPSMQGSLCTFLRTTGTYRNGAASGGDLAQSFLFGGMLNANYGSLLTSPFFYLHNTLTGSRTVTVHLLTDSPCESDINDTDIWLESFYPSSNTTPKYSHASTENANVGVPACTKTPITLDGSASWTSPTISFPTAFKLALTMTIQRSGILFLRLNVAGMKLSRHILFVCPYIDVA